MSKVNLGYRTPEETRKHLAYLQWCVIIWYRYDDNSVAVTTCPSLKACLREVYESIGVGNQDKKKELVKHVIENDEYNPFEYDGCDSCTIQTLEDKYHFQYTAKELDYELS